MNPRTIASPEKKPVAWWPLIFAIFIGFVFVGPYFRHAGRREWALDIFGVVAFFTFYSVALARWYDRRVALWMLAGVTMLGFIYAPYNEGAALYIIFATSFVPYIVGGDIKLSVAIIGLILAVVGLESWLLHLPWYYWAYSGGYSVIIGAANIFSARQAFATERLAKMAERERIARDLHDVLGHTLSVIVLKSELAGKLLDRDPGRARAEIADVEKISREALAEVRHTISGYQAENLKDAFERARATLETAGVAVESRSEKVDITAAEEGVLALVLREAVTNVVRHAGAKKCELKLQETDGACRLEIYDDGRGGLHSEGFGRRGMRERIEALGGTLKQETQSGTRLIITLPLSSGTGTES
jgi:two-component system sensor histidine kinase DesK